MFRNRKSGDRKDPEQPLERLDEDMLVIVEKAVDPYVVMFHDPVSYRAEQIRALRNQLIAMNPDQSSKTLVVTSAMKGEGKTVTAINLALAFAELERNSVLLVDGDMRQPGVEKKLNLDPAPGLADVLLDQVSLDEAIRSSGSRNLSLLSAGMRTTSPAELLNRGRLDQLFARCKERFQFVIIDTPPVLPATDAGVLAALADGTLVVVRLEKSEKRPTADALRTLQDLGGNVLGTFVTELRGPEPDSDSRFAYGEGDR